MAETETSTTTTATNGSVTPTDVWSSSTPAPDWRESLPGELRADKILADFKDVGALAKSYVETKRLVGDAVRLPKADAKPEEITAFHRKLGVPESPDKYDVKLPEMPKDFPAWNEQVVNDFKTGAHRQGFTPSQLQWALQYYAEHQVKEHGENSSAAAVKAKEAEAACIAELEKVWGPQGGLPWKRELGRAWNVTKMLFGADTPEGEMFEMHGNNPKLLLKLASLAPELGEDRFIDGETSVAQDEATLSAKIEETRNALKTAAQGSVRHRDLKNQLDNLYQQKFGKR